MGCAAWLLLLLGCGPATPADQPVQPQRDAPAAASSQAPTWAQMARPARERYMAEVVLPRMTELFQELDATLFAEVTCATCHRDDSYTMPNPRLAQLGGDMRFTDEMRHSPEFTMFMVGQVVPEMARLLGEEPWNGAPAGEATGFDCFRCHVADPER